jgi:hypothetical protein
MKKLTGILLLGILALGLQACGNDGQPAAGADQGGTPAQMPRSIAPPGAAVFFITPMDGQTVKSPVTVKFGISGMSVVPAGEMAPASGHHHLLVDTELGDASLPVPKDDQHLHFGKGQTETTLELAPGQHSLQLVLGDGNHVPHDPPVVSPRITITVE